MSKAAAFAEWLDSRMPTLKREWNRHMAEYYAPKTLTGGITLVCCPWWFWLSSWSPVSGC